MSKHFAEHSEHSHSRDASGDYKLVHNVGSFVSETVRTTGSVVGTTLDTVNDVGQHLGRMALGITLGTLEGMRVIGGSAFGMMRSGLSSFSKNSQEGREGESAER
jgi:hypothetical protein